MEAGLRGAQGGWGARRSCGRRRERGAFLFDRIYRMDRIPEMEDFTTESTEGTEEDRRE